MANQTNPQHPPPIYQTPDWETPLNPPKRFHAKGKPQVLGDALGLSRANTSDRFAKETLSRTPTQRSSLELPILPPSKPLAQPSTRTRLLALYDRLLPPHKLYWGRSRRFFALFILLPLLVFFLFILPLTLGLTLRRKSKSINLPLPTNTGGIWTGDLTFYAPALGACGWESTENDAICAVSHLLWDELQEGTNPNTNPLCGKWIRVQRDFVEEGKGNQSVDVMVVDRCTGCAETDLDLSLTVFTALAREGDGRVVGKWAWLDTT